MLSYENPTGDFQGITYETPRSGISFKAAGEYNLPAALKSDLVPGNGYYLRRFSLEIRER